MLSALVAATALAFVSGPASDGNAVTEMRQSNRGLIVGTWELRLAGDVVEVLDFRRDGRFTQTVFLPELSPPVLTSSGTYRVDGQRLAYDTHEGHFVEELVQLDRRVLVLRLEGNPNTMQYRRR